MFVVSVNETRFEYDVNSLVKAFYPKESVKVITPDMGEEKKAELCGKVRLVIEFAAEGVTFRFMKAENSSDSGLTDYGTSAADIAYAAVDKVYTWQADAGSREDEDFKAYKAGFKRFLYSALSDYTGRVLPWGNLTGIRPTKIAMGLLEEGKGEEEIRCFMQEEHFVSEDKAKLSVEIAKREKELLSKVHYEDGYSLYVGIPFCPTTCLYCSFTSFPVRLYQKKVEAYLDCLVQEMRAVKEIMGDRILDSVYIGGGTPTTLEAEQLDRLLTAIKETFEFASVQEFTVEAGRADSITREKLEVLKAHGVDRISINPQTMKEETLHLIGRQATPAQVKEAFLLAREVGDFNINMDIILGLPDENAEDVHRTIEEIKELAPDSLTVHSLAIKRASKLSRWILENGIETLRNTDETMAIAAKGAKALSMHPYYLYRQKNMSGNFENVGYAKEGNYGLYNILIMEEVQTIVACGAGSISKRVYPDGRIERCENVKEVAQYIERIGEMIERKRILFGD
ncbi:MAG: coproporphyrinogen dehydrogenase HemZ [Lachnospiraceae bacterium]|nr:coproporphyrinogen dehydrogenase HemZ [Lachnospiraceae bacterium]